MKDISKLLRSYTIVEARDKKISVASEHLSYF